MSQKKDLLSALFRGGSGGCCDMKIVPQPPKTGGCCGSQPPKKPDATPKKK